MAATVESNPTSDTSLSFTTLPPPPLETLLYADIITRFRTLSDEEDPSATFKGVSPVNFSGRAKAHYISGDTYAGDYKEGLMDGTGVYMWRDGDVYSGEVSKNALTGRGVYKWQNGCDYEGEVVRGLRHGTGVFRLNSVPVVYEGQWSEGCLNGFGKIVYDQEGKTYYEGYFHNNMKHGRGKMVYASGNVYEGEWKNDARNGHGTMHWLNRRETYVGQWKNGLPHGQGMYTWELNRRIPHQFPKVNSYNGNWENGKRAGYGEFCYSTGSIYKGEWKENMKHGKGVFIYDDGRCYDGEWKHDRIVGECPPYDDIVAYTFGLKPILSPGEQHNERQILIDLNRVIFRHLDSLRKLYDTYASLYKDRTSAVESFALTRCRLYKMLWDYNLNKMGLNLVKVNLLFAKNFEDHPILHKLYESPQEYSTEFNFREFVHYLVYVATWLHKSDLERDLEKGLAGCLSRLMTQELSGSPGKSFNGNKFERILPADLPQDVFIQQNLPKLLSIYESRMCPIKKVMTVRGFILFLESYGLVGHGRNVKQLIDLIGGILPNIWKEDFVDLNYEITSYEFYHLVYECAHMELDNATASETASDSSNNVLDADEFIRRVLAVAG